MLAGYKKKTVKQLAVMKHGHINLELIEHLIVWICTGEHDVSVCSLKRRRYTLTSCLACSSLAMAQYLSSCKATPTFCACTTNC